jgi:GNAT superfamily N-acetyltransferase
MLSIRAAAPTDEKPVLALLEELFDPPSRRAPGYTRERGAAGFRHAVSSPDADVLLAVDGDPVVGLASVYVVLPSMRFGHRCWLEDLIVTSSRRSEGIGRLLLEAATSGARAHGCTHLELESAAARKDAHRFYVASGMTQTALSFARWIG